MQFSYFQKIRESELKHGRVAMIAFLGMIVGENFNPLFDGKITGPAIYQFQQADDLVSFFWAGVLFAIALVEGQNITNGWEDFTDTNNRKLFSPAQLKEDYINGIYLISLLFIVILIASDPKTFILSITFNIYHISH